MQVSVLATGPHPRRPGIPNSALPAPLHGRAEVAAMHGDQFWRAFPDLTIDLADGPFLHPTAPRAMVDWRDGVDLPRDPTVVVVVAR